MVEGTAKLVLIHVYCEWGASLPWQTRGTRVGGFYGGFQGGAGHNARMQGFTPISPHWGKTSYIYFKSLDKLNEFALHLDDTMVHRFCYLNRLTLSNNANTKGTRSLSVSVTQGETTAMKAEFESWLKGTDHED